MCAIPTAYRGTRFRSRLEARWAAFFDLMHWPWEYEPLDLVGYIPDFILQFRQPLLAEVKPALSFSGLREFIPKIEASGWDGEALVVGAYLFDTESPVPLIGLLSSPDAEGPARLFSCGVCENPSIYRARTSLEQQDGSFRCRVSDCVDERRHMNLLPDDPLSAWAEAGNATQWRRPR